jgi:hypothetical protein
MNGRGGCACIQGCRFGCRCERHLRGSRPWRFRVSQQFSWYTSRPVPAWAVLRTACYEGQAAGLSVALWHVFQRRCCMRGRGLGVTTARPSMSVGAGSVAYGRPQSRAVWRRECMGVKTQHPPNTPNLRPDSFVSKNVPLEGKRETMLGAGVWVDGVRQEWHSGKGVLEVGALESRGSPYWERRFLTGSGVTP